MKCLDNYKIIKQKMGIYMNKNLLQNWPIEPFRNPSKGSLEIRIQTKDCLISNMYFSKIG